MLVIYETYSYSFCLTKIERNSIVAKKSFLFLQLFYVDTPSKTEINIKNKTK